ncbi:MAG: GNAT family N-acetyltransferase [Bacteroidetes bacterium]|nr:GNAT family N-acetyltransferase [Bacteroidota bacterium]
MDLKTLNPSQLERFIHSEEFHNMPVIPISRHRALSHIHNPRIDPNDIVMVIAYEDNRMAGYLGVFSDRIYLNQQELKAGWLSCMWVDPNLRGRGIAKKLLNKVLETWDQRILVTEFTQAAKGLYDRSGAFVDLKQSEGIRGYLRLDFEGIIPRKSPGLKRFKPFFRMSDAILNLANQPRLKLTQKNPKVRWAYINFLDEELEKFISSRQEGQLTRRRAEDINWIIKYPWILSAPKKDFLSQRYHFSALEKRFDVLNLKLTDTKGNLVGYIMLTIRGNYLKVPYFYVEPEFISEAAKIILNHMIDAHLRIITTFHPELVAYFRENSQPFIHLRKAYRNYIISKVFQPYHQEQPNVLIQDGDADCAFT